MKWICGFANAQGGKIYIGMRDDGTVLGVQNAKRLLDDLPNKIKNRLGIVADVNLLIEGEHEYIEIAVSPWSFPVNYDGAYYYRSGSTKQLLRGNALTGFLMDKTGLKWDAVTNTNVGVEDLDQESFNIFRREALRSGRMTKEDLEISNAELLEKLDLIAEESSNVLLPYVFTVNLRKSAPVVMLKSVNLKEVKFYIRMKYTVHC